MLALQELPCIFYHNTIKKSTKINKYYIKSVIFKYNPIYKYIPFPKKQNRFFSLSKISADFYAIYPNFS